MHWQSYILTYMFTHSNEELVWRHVRQSRSELLDYLHTLDDDAWNTQSLCSGWLTKDVVAHLVLEYRYTPANSWRDFIRSGLSVNQFMQQTAAKLGGKPKHHLLSLFQTIINEQQKPRSVSVLNILADLLVHEQDIRIPLGHPKNIPLDKLHLVFTHWHPTKFNFGERITGLSNRVKDLEFIVSDLGISKGNGSQIAGNAQDVLLAIAGRSVSISNLRGSGVTILHNRLK